MTYGRMQLPGPAWSARTFPSNHDAWAFYRDLCGPGREPRQLLDDVIGPDERVLFRGTWLVVYEVFG